MSPRLFFALIVLGLTTGATVSAQETFVGSFAEPRDGGNLDTAHSTFDGSTVLIVPRSHASEAVNGATRWRNVLFAIRGVQGRAPSFVLPLVSPTTGKMILSGDAVSHQNIKLVWSYQPNAVKWNSFDAHARTGSSSSSWKIEAMNTAPFEQDIVYVSINERFPVADFYEWLEADVFVHPSVKPTPSESTPGTFVIGYQSGAPASSSFSRAIPDMPLFGFVIRDPAANPTKLVMLVSGQHPYEGQNKVALQAAVDWILHSSSPEAKAYRALYTTLVYPFVNPTGELAGLWRGTAVQPMVDTNRNWKTTETIPSRNRGIDTVIVHKNAMKKDIALLGLGEPYAMFDYHQNFGDRVGKPDYLLHSSGSDLATAPAARQASASDYAPYYARIAGLSGIAEIASDLTTSDTLRGYMISRGVKLPITFERSVYNTIASEWTFGMATVQALVDPSSLTLPLEPMPESVLATSLPASSDVGAVETSSSPRVLDTASEAAFESSVEPELVSATADAGHPWFAMDEFAVSGSLNGGAPESLAWQLRFGRSQHLLSAASKPEAPRHAE